MWEQVFLSTIVAIAVAWITARAEHFDLTRRLVNVEGFLRGIYARSARAEKKDQAASIIREFVAPAQLQTPEQILAEARRKGLMDYSDKTRENM